MRNQSSISFCNPDKKQTVHPFVSARGFSMIELMLVLGIILIVSAMAFPVVRSSMANYQLHASASSVTTAIQSARYQAISQGYPFQILFDKNAGTYQFKSDQDGDGVFDNVQGPIPFGNISNTLGANATLQFSPGGSVKPIPPGTITLVVTGSGRTGTITVSNYGNVNVVYAP